MEMILVVFFAIRHQLAGVTYQRSPYFAANSFGVFSSFSPLFSREIVA